MGSAGDFVWTPFGAAEFSPCPATRWSDADRVSPVMTRAFAAPAVESVVRARRRFSPWAGVAGERAAREERHRITIAVERPHGIDHRNDRLGDPVSGMVGKPPGARCSANTGTDFSGLMVGAIGPTAGCMRRRT
jgi:hypothetical protein